MRPARFAEAIDEVHRHAVRGNQPCDRHARSDKHRGRRVAADHFAFRSRFGDRGLRRHRQYGFPALEGGEERSEEHTSELQSLMRISYAVFCLKKKKQKLKYTNII